MNVTIPKSALLFLEQLKENNYKEWFVENKSWFDKEEVVLKSFFQQVMNGLNENDTIESLKIYRIYKDVRFSKDKSPYKIYRSCSFTRATAALRGGYHLEITPKKSFLAIGFWMPNKEDLYRIRKEFELDDTEIRAVLADKNLQQYFNGFYEGETLKTIPKGFDKNHPAADLLKKKDFLLYKEFTDEEVTSENFYETVMGAFVAARPFLDLMSAILTTDLNGESIL